MSDSSSSSSGGRRVFGNYEDALVSSASAKNSYWFNSTYLRPVSWR